jgi:hypothetical protein
MWGLFTRALTLATSTVRVSIINTSANFMITAFLGALIFSESLPGLWWLGAALLVAGSVIIGRREGNKVGSTSTAGNEPLLAAGDGDVLSGERFRDEELDKSGAGNGSEGGETLELASVKNVDDDDEDGVLK